MDNAFGALIAAAVGLFYLLAPHALHESTGLGLYASHLSHQVFGASLLLVAGALYITKRPRIRVSSFQYNYRPKSRKLKLKVTK